jgi:hypothetical protein
MVVVIVFSVDKDPPPPRGSSSLIARVYVGGCLPSGVARVVPAFISSPLVLVIGRSCVIRPVCSNKW